MVTTVRSTVCLILVFSLAATFNSIIRAQDLPNLELHFTFDDEANLAMDSSGNNRHGQIDELELFWVSAAERGGVIELGVRQTVSSAQKFRNFRVTISRSPFGRIVIRLFVAAAVAEMTASFKSSLTATHHRATPAKKSLVGGCKNPMLLSGAECTPMC